MEEIASAAADRISTRRSTVTSPTARNCFSAMAAASVQELAAPNREAALEVVPFEEAIARLARGIVAAGSRYTALSGDRREVH